MQIEDLINHSKKAKEFLNTNKEHTKEFHARIRAGNTNFIQENKADARVWKDLDIVVKEEFSQVHTSRIGLAKIKHTKIVNQQHVEAVNNLSKQATNKKIKGHILGVINQTQENRDRLYKWKGLIIADTITKYYWKTAHGIAEAKRRALREKLAIGAMKRIIKDHMNHRGYSV